ncbi:hypothetical protein HY311_00800 [Candidatus Nomurabacteria bacterium]|nr:hypothetical protein [Candidatus Nomurabacteria bacterium]
MDSETKICQNCKKDFTIEPEDFNFYEKIKVPPPTFCPECRLIRRMAWRNVRSLYKRSCGLCEKSLISMYSDKDTAPVYCTECYYGGNWDQFVNAKEYDFSKTFFEQLSELLKINPRFYAYKFGNLINSEFINFAIDDKNCYLSYSVIYCEDVSYSENIDNSKNSLDCLAVNKLDNCYQNIDCELNYNTHYAIKSNNCIDSYFLYDCKNCQNCFLSSNLRNQQYYFNNIKLSKEEYFKKLKEYYLETHAGIEKAKKEFELLTKEKSIHKYASIYASQNATGDYIHNSRNIKRSFNTIDSENVAYSYRVIKSKDVFDSSGLATGELIYEGMAPTGNTFKDFFCYITIEGCRECEYSFILKNCSNCFGCVGLTNAKFYILNKQYSEKEYFEILGKIKEQMMKMPYIDNNGRIYKYGEFFPIELSFFAYNETQAQEYFPLTKREALKQGYKWKDRIERNYKIDIKNEDIPDNLLDVNESIIGKVIECEHQGECKEQCTEAFKITASEFQFYKRINLPIPHLCPNCRHIQRIEQRNPPKLWHRQCMKPGCANEFETSYAPERPEIVYCEKCYQQEVY